MANILAILPGMSFVALEAMSPAELMRWHRMAAARAPKQER
jgi:hypothetical protein